MVSALRPTCVLSFAGQLSRQRVQPVQSSTETWMVKRWSARSRHFAGADLKPSGASASMLAGTTLERTAACGQLRTHLPHWMHRSGSQTGTSRAMLRFSQAAVPVGKVPSTGSLLTGISSPRLAMISAVTFCTNSGAPAGTAAARPRVLVIWPGTFAS